MTRQRAGRMKRSLCLFARVQSNPGLVPTHAKPSGLRLLLVVLYVAAASVLLAACSGASAALLPDTAVRATATACGCNCYLYGSYPHTTPSATPTPTGTWVPHAKTPRPTKTRPPLGCDYCTIPPAPTQEPPHWPPPIVTCTARPDEPTFTTVPTMPPAIFPTLPPNTPLPAAIGDTPPISIGSMGGDALPGGVATHPLTGRPYLIWSQFNGDSRGRFCND